MANSTTAFFPISTDVLLYSVVFKFVAMIIGVLGNVTVIIYTIFFSKEKTPTCYLVGNLALADLLMCLTFYPTWIVEFLQFILNIDSDQDLFCKVSRSMAQPLLFASIGTLLAITIDRYLYIIKPLKYVVIVTRRRVFFAVLGIWLIACCLFVVIYVHIRSFGNRFRSFCYIPDVIGYFVAFITAYIPLTLIFFFNFRIFSIARRQRKRIFTETVIAGIDNSNTELGSKVNYVLRFFVAIKAAKTFAIVFSVLTFCVLTPPAVGKFLSNFCSESCQQIWFVCFKYELQAMNSIVNVFIYGIRHVKYRKAYLDILFKLLTCRKAVTKNCV